MVKLTADIIARGTSGYAKKKRDESVPHFLKRLTHLYLEDRGIDEIGDDLGACKHLVVLYLYDNKLGKVPNLNHNGSLTHLYLQNNQISRMDGFNGLKRLQKLYIGGNSITVLEGLDKLDQLQELHIENQRMPAGEQLLLDPRTMVVIAPSLQVLNISSNNLTSLSELQPFRNLTQLMANDNHLSDLKEIAHIMNMWRHLWRLELMGNPLCHNSKYRDRVIIMAPSLEVLDGKEISETAKKFLQNWQANKEAIKRKRESSFFKDTQPMDGDIGAYGEGQRHMPRGAKSAAAASRLGNDEPGYIMPAMHRKQFQEVLARSVSHAVSADLVGRPMANRTISDVTGAARYFNSWRTGYDRYSTSVGSLHGRGHAPHCVSVVTMGSSYAGGDLMPR